MRRDEEAREKMNLIEKCEVCEIVKYVCKSLTFCALWFEFFAEEQIVGDMIAATVAIHLEKVHKNTGTLNQ